jgi:hypothetical protein
LAYRLLDQTIAAKAEAAIDLRQFLRLDDCD